MKTTRFSDPKYVGDPINAVRIFNEKEVDELVLLDIDASRDKREPEYDQISEIVSEAFMPVAYGGGIATVEQAQKVIALGVEKVVINHAALSSVDLVRGIADRLGSSSTVVAIDVKRSWMRRPSLYSSVTARTVETPWLRHLQDVVAAGAGEVFLNAVDRDGTMSGMDVDLIQQASRAVGVPLIAIGGAGSLEHFRQAIDAGASAVAAGAYFVFHGPHRAVLITYPSYGELKAALGSDR